MGSRLLSRPKAVNCQLPSTKVAGKSLTIIFIQAPFTLRRNSDSSTSCRVSRDYGMNPPQGKPISYCLLEATLGRLFALQEMRLRRMQRNLFRYQSSGRIKKGSL
ncbi:hypothetical protein FOXG_18967 [Fusarium oxysporum f. sp. lycopersici 4287]|uniref:Uncharacterized protein n=2 Tax=Fusarium oxysporum TaxID=5507 RepID=A0A0J9URJ6_FUSO4|nr:hypothetical protein FOXG_18967 [Fusarium oxysporum f. sp. lycopersici 4287]XP_018239960.1 hypothetical protein FOXG_18967 [Fusarium oxysporum f. sp. lycopersici 4287]XP_018239961.1 hypothetical protein FOXG_18967 [Fusarium oxysporum f. sp. lycopersici 4287]XP_018239962.1 hypothetical protein FOXG_18967 [Fusarium oxysporum f. sp. lycopersici 4287]EXK38845.1 hypothetical protein FOMG_06363 [Fusarium oxysporum f. sp. melonis 26406]EXK38846.1 hypothetical protein FOMG_06363 [Fusarium oxysporum